MMYHLFHNSIWKVVRIAKTSDCKISWRVFSQGTVTLKSEPLIKTKTNWSSMLQRSCHLGSRMFLRLRNLKFYDFSKFSCSNWFLSASIKSIH